MSYLKNLLERYYKNNKILFEVFCYDYYYPAYQMLSQGRDIRKIISYLVEHVPMEKLIDSFHPIYINDLTSSKKPDIDLQKYFVNGSVPSSRVYTDKIHNELLSIRRKQQDDKRHCIRFENKNSLNIGFMIGHEFASKAGFILAVKQSPFENYYISNKVESNLSSNIKWQNYQILGDPSSRNELIIIIRAGTIKKSKEIIAKNIASFLQEDTAVFAKPDEWQAYKLSENYKGCFMLNAEHPDNEKFTNEQLVALAQIAINEYFKFVEQFEKPYPVVNLFLAVPFSLAVFLGHYWNPRGPDIQLYEWIGGSKMYQMTIGFPLK